MLSSRVFQVVVIVLSGCGLSEQESCSTEGSVRIVDSNGMESLEGRVEFCHNNEWGTVCDDFWRCEEAMVVCRQLNLSYESATGGFDTPDGSGPIWLDYVRCTGSETHLADCPANYIGTCGHDEDAGVVCSSLGNRTGCIYNGAIRLRGGSDTSGRVEVCHSGIWRTLCHDQWDNTDAGVACRQLGYSADGATKFQAGYSYYCDQEVMWLDELQCTGSETRLIDCPVNPLGEHDCDYFEDAGVICIPDSDRVPMVQMNTQDAQPMSSFTVLPSPSNSLHLTASIEATIPSSGKNGTDTTARPARTVVGGIVGAIVALFAAAIAVCFIARRIKRQHKTPYMRRVQYLPHEQQAINPVGIDNTVHSPAVDESNSDKGAGEVWANHSRLSDLNTDNDTCLSDLNADNHTGLSDLNTENVDKTASEKAVCVLPADNEDDLYSQLTCITILEVPRKSLELKEVIGSGQFGTVHKGVWLSQSQRQLEVAVKILKEGSGEEDRVKFLQEAAIMGQFKHPNVVEMYGVVAQGEPVVIILELLSRGDLRNHLLYLREKCLADSCALLSYCCQVASGMAYLSSKAFVHRDIAARNILVSEDDLCKIAGFGMSRDLLDETYYLSHGRMIPVKWTAPEALHFKKYSTASDVWSYGALLYEIWSVGHKPFEDCNKNQVMSLIDSGFRLPPPPGCPREVYATMIKCWHSMTSERPSFSDIQSCLSLPATRLLKWSEEDRSVHPEAAQLGADLLCGHGLYRDLQTSYTNDN